MSAIESKCQNPACEGGFVPAGEASGPYLAPTKPCPDCERRKRVLRLSDGYSRAGLPEVLKGYRLPSDSRAKLTPVETTEPGWDEIEGHAARMRDVIELGINFLFVGPPGTGKSQAGSLMLTHAARLGYTVLAVSVPAWVMLVQNDYTDDEGETEFKHVNRLAAADLLMLDDVGADLAKDHSAAGRLISRVIDLRYQNMRGTIITTNLQARADSNKVEELLGDRAYDRFSENVIKLAFVGKNYRREAQRSRLAEYTNRLQAAD